MTYICFRHDCDIYIMEIMKIMEIMDGLKYQRRKCLSIKKTKTFIIHLKNKFKI